MGAAVCSVEGAGAHPAPAALHGLGVVGWSHHGSPLAVLEQVALPRGERPAVLAALAAAGCVDAVILSTCSRTELYAGPSGPAPDELLAWFVGHRQLSAAVTATAERRAGLSAVEHLFRVTAGLESRVVGEAEIRSQVRGSVREAQLAGLPLPVLGSVFAAAGRCAVRVDDVTGLSAQARSMGRRAVDVGLAEVRRVADPVILVVGAGRMARTAVERLRELGRLPQVAARRDLEASRLAGGGSTCPLPALAAGVARADLLICATSASHDVVTLDHVRQAMRRRERPLTVVDLSVPRNVDVTVATVPGVRLIDVEGLRDDLGTDHELAAKLAAGSAVVRAEAARYADAVRARAAGPVIAAAREAVEQLCLRELTRVATDVEPAELARAAHALTGKLLHRASVTARAAAATGDARVLDVLGELFCTPSTSTPLQRACDAPRR